MLTRLERCRIESKRMTNHNTPPTFTNGSGQPLRSFSWTVTSKHPSCTRKNAFITELETSARTESKRLTNHNTPQLSGMDSANHCAAFPALSALSTTTILGWPRWSRRCGGNKKSCRHRNGAPARWL
jgi:hypothetical protein